MKAASPRKIPTSISSCMNAPHSDDTHTFVFRRPQLTEPASGPIPEDLRSWQPAVALARRVREVLNQRPDGPAASAADALPAVVLWCLATGRYGSTDIAALCEEEPMCHHLSGGFPFTWSDVQRCRRDRKDEMASVLAHLLERCCPPAVAKSGPDFRSEAARRLELAAQTDHEALES